MTVEAAYGLVVLALLVGALILALLALAAVTTRA